MRSSAGRQSIVQSFVEDMVQEGLITPSQLAVARVSQENLGEDLGQILIGKGFVTEDQLLHFLAKSLSVPHASLTNQIVDLSVVKAVPVHLLKRYYAIPLRQEDGQALVAMADPRDMSALEDLKDALHMEIKPLLASRREIEDAIQKYLGSEPHPHLKALEYAEMMEFAGQESHASGKTAEGEHLEKIASGPKVVMAVNEIIARAFEEKASDIHLEPTEKGVRVRYRIDGFLAERQPLPASMLLPIVSRLKILGGMDIAERRSPQDGRMRLKIGNAGLDLRLSTYPTLYGEKVVARLLVKDTVIGVESLGFNPRERKIFMDLIMKSHGIFLVTGPTGSGKSTTLYAALSRTNSSEKNIISIEDPIESEIAGVNQAQINQRAGVTFAVALRSILRQDPDVIMIGEVRDAETAQMAVRAAITGHLVLSTLHTNTASGTISRLMDLGVEPFLLSSALIGVLAQRLVRKICPSCRRPVSADLSKLGDNAHLVKAAYQGAGCADCRMSGYVGRIGIFELAPIGDTVRKLINEKSSDAAIEQEFRRLGVKAMIEDGMEKVNAGVTTIEEVLRVTQED